MVQLGSEWTWFSSRESRLRISRYPGEDAFLGSHKGGDCTQHRFSSCKGFLLPPHPQVRTPVSRKRFARSYAPLLITFVVYLKLNIFSLLKSVFGDRKRSNDHYSRPSRCPGGRGRGSF